MPLDTLLSVCNSAEVRCGGRGGKGFFVWDVDEDKDKYRPASLLVFSPKDKSSDPATTSSNDSLRSTRISVRYPHVSPTLCSGGERLHRRSDFDPDPHGV